LLEERPELVNEQPYGDGWLVVIEPSSDGAEPELLDAKGYQAFVTEGTEA
jgi:glycine cleavage system H protein